MPDELTGNGAMTGADAPSAAFRRQWWKQTLVAVWSAPAQEWYCPAVDSVVAVLAGRARDAPSIDAACGALGVARAAAGVLLDEARADLAVGARVAAADQALTGQLVDRLTLGWVDRTLDSIFTSPCIDPLTELASVPYLTTRLSEVYAEARLRREDADSRHVLVCVRTQLTSDRLLAQGRLVAVQSALRHAFAGGETLAAVGTHCAVALAGRGEPRLTESLTALRRELGNAHRAGLLPQVGTRLASLPASYDQLPTLLRDVMR